MSDWLPIIAPAWIAGVLIALLSAPLGCLVLWRRMAFFGYFGTWCIARYSVCRMAKPAC